MGRRKRKQRKFEFTVAAIQERWGVRAIQRASDTETNVPVCSTGFQALDHLLSGGGLPLGRFSELVGHGTAGHFTVAATTLAQAQQAGKRVAYYVDVETTLDLETLVRCGVRLEALITLRPRGLRHALAITGDLLRAGSVGMVVFDRIHDLPLLADGELCRALEQALRDWTPVMHRSLSTVLFLTETTSPGLYAEGLPLPYFATVRLQFEQRAWLQRGSRITGYISRVTVIKNRLGPSGQSVELRLTV